MHGYVGHGKSSCWLTQHVSAVFAVLPSESGMNSIFFFFLGSTFYNSSNTGYKSLHKTLYIISTTNNSREKKIHENELPNL